MNKKNIFVYIFVSLFVIIYLFAANKIILNLSGHGSDVKKTNLIPEETKYVYYGVDKFYALNDFLEQITFEGWAFIEDYDTYDKYGKPSLYVNLDKRIHIYFINDDNQYQIITNPDSRIDLWDAFKDKAKITGGYHGFTTTFSTIGIRDGIYDVYIESFENENLSGCMKSKYQFVKNKGEISLKTREEKEIIRENFNLIENERFQGELDVNEINKDGNIYFSGWGIFLDDTPDFYDSYIALGEGENIKGVYVAQRQLRNDVSDANNSNNKMNGFSAVISSEEIDYQYDTIYLVQKVGSEVYYYLLEENIEEEVINNFALESNTQFVGAIDELLYDSTGSVIISGWGTDPQCDWTEYNVYVGYVLDSKIVSIVEAERGARPDISEAFAIDDQNAGFYANIPEEKVPDTYDKLVLIKEKDGECHYYELKEKKEEIIAREFELAKEHDFRGSIDSFDKMDDGSASISGWGVDLQKPLDDYNMYIILIADDEIKTVVSAERKEREDISEAYGLQDNRTGFWAHIPANNLPDDYDTVVLAIETADDISYYKLEEK